MKHPQIPRQTACRQAAYSRLIGRSPLGGVDRDPRHHQVLAFCDAELHRIAIIHYQGKTPDCVEIPCLRSVEARRVGLLRITSQPSSIVSTKQGTLRAGSDSWVPWSPPAARSRARSSQALHLVNPEDGSTIINGRAWALPSAHLARLWPQTPKWTTTAPFKVLNRSICAPSTLDVNAVAGACGQIRPLDPPAFPLRHRCAAHEGRCL